MRVLILSQYYDPEPVPKPGELARELLKNGHQVDAITGFPNYPSGDLYSGYRLSLLQRETIDGVNVVRTFEYPYHGRSALGRLINYWSMVLSAPFGALFVRRPDVMYVWHPPLTIGVAAWLISRIRRIPFVYDVQDIWPDVAALSGMFRPGLMMKAMSLLERFVYRRAAHILVVTPGARENLISKGVPPDRVTVMHHWFDESIFTNDAGERRDAVRAERGWSGDFVVLFAGNIGMVQGLDSVVRAAALLDPAEKIRIVLVGDGADKEPLQALALELKTGDRLTFVDRQPMAEMPTFMAAADALLVHLRRSPLSNYIIPTKTLAYLAAGKPIVMATDGAAADLVEEAKAGIVLPADEPRQLVDVVRQLAGMPASERDAFGRAGRSFLEAKMSKARIVPQYEQLLARVAGVS